MFNRPGCWWLRSETNPEWNCDGESPWVGGFELPEEAKDKIRELKLILGEPPLDLTYSYMKD